MPRRIIPRAILPHLDVVWTGSGKMRAVMGIDAAWTLTNPSGVALAVENRNSWRVIAAATSYQRFHALADGGLVAEERPTGSSPEACALLASASVLCGHPVDLVAIDMPLARSPIVGRRNSDNAVSKAYGGRNCGTHSPNADRPGRISDDLRESFDLLGYPLRTDYPLRTHVVPPFGVIEVYPHPALVELAGASERLPYKYSNRGKYWPFVDQSERRTLLYRQWNEIVAKLENEIAGVAAALPRLELDASGWKMKAYEDALDAIICAWVAVCALEERATPFGDENSAIWIPRPRVSAGR